ncbi:MAG: hypothetical protein AABY14_00805, partial [Nanoarchaeota archaeon]
TFSLEIGSPSISLIYPHSNSYISNTEATFNYTPIDTNLDACELWTNSTTWGINLTDLTPTSKIRNTFKLNLSDNPYIWNIKCNDTLGNNAFSSNNFTVTIDIIEPIVTPISPSNNSVDTDAELSFVYNISDTNPISNCSLILNNNITLSNNSIIKDSTINFSVILNSGKYNWSINCSDIAGNINNTETRILTIIKSTEFTEKTTNFSAVQLSNISNLTLEVPLYGRIIFHDTTDLSAGHDLDKNINISFAKIELNSSALGLLNKSATLMSYNLTFTEPLILRDGSTCPSTICKPNTYIKGNFTFNVTHFTTYSVVETPVEVAPSAESVSTSGGGGAAAKKEEKKAEKIEEVPEIINKKFEIDLKQIIVDTRVNKDIVRTFNVKNTGNVPIDVSISTKGITLKVSAQSFKLVPNEEKQITISFISDKTGLYIGKILVNADGIEKVITLSIGVESLDALFDISIDIPSDYTRIEVGSALKAQITLINVLSNIVDVTLNYLIKDTYG